MKRFNINMSLFYHRESNDKNIQRIMNNSDFGSDSNNESNEYGSNQMIKTMYVIIMTVKTIIKPQQLAITQ